MIFKNVELIKNRLIISNTSIKNEININLNLKKSFDAKHKFFIT